MQEFLHVPGGGSSGPRVGSGSAEREDVPLGYSNREGQVLRLEDMYRKP